MDHWSVRFAGRLLKKVIEVIKKVIWVILAKVPAIILPMSLIPPIALISHLTLAWAITNHEFQITLCLSSRSVAV